MAMLITKFHRLIRNRLLWLIFLVIVVFSFVIWGTQMPSAKDRQQANSAGQLDSQDIPFETYQRARFNTYLSLVLMSGRPITITPEIEEQLHELAWQRIAALREADKLGITSDNEEVVQAIRGFDFLKTDGRFNPQAYEQFELQFLRQFRATKREFEEHVRQEIILQKLRSVIDRFQLITPTEISRTFTTLTDNFEIEYVKVPPSLVEDSVEVSADDIEAFYTKEPQLFAQPEKVKVKAASFPVSDFTNNVTISDAEIEEYYDFNLEKYAIPQEDEDTNTFSLATTQYRPLEEVRQEIAEILTKRQALILAQDEASAFVQELSNRRAEGRQVFDQVAAEKGVELTISSLFSIRDIPPEIEEANLSVVRAAFNLSDDDDFYYSDPIALTNHVYVLSLLERKPERIPEFDEVRGEAEKMAREFAVFNALQEKAQEIQASAVAGLSAGLSFDEVLEAYKLTPVKPKPFTMNTVELEPDIASDLIREILVRNAGEVTEVIQAGDEILIGYVKSRTPSTDASLESLRPQIVGTLRRQAGPVNFSEFQTYVLKKGGFQDFMRRKPSQPVDDEEPAPEEG